MATASGAYLLRDEYIDHRATQDRQINVAIDLVRGSIEGVKEDLHDFREETRGEFSNMRRDLDDFKVETRYEFASVRQNLDDFKVETRSEFASVRQELDDFKVETRYEFASVRQNLDDFKVETRSEFASVRQELDDFKVETRSGFRSVRESIAGVQKNLDDFKVEVRSEFANVRRDINTKFTSLEAQQKQSTAWLRNQLLSNPILPIHPVVAIHETRGTVLPQAALFPKNAKEFYAMREPHTARLRAKLAYLVEFYDVVLPENMGGSSSSGSSSSDDGDDGDDDDNDGYNDGSLFKDRNYLAVHMLEGILGLSEDNFLTFSERARERAARARESAQKRSQPALPVGAPSTHRPFRTNTEATPGTAQPFDLIITRAKPPFTLSQLQEGFEREKPGYKPPPDSLYSFAKVSWREGESWHPRSRSGNSGKKTPASRPQTASAKDGEGEAGEAAKIQGSEGSGASASQKASKHLPASAAPSSPAAPNSPDARGPPAPEDTKAAASQRSGAGSATEPFTETPSSRRVRGGARTSDT